jgi:hypothetical protein
MQINITYDSSVGVGKSTEVQGLVSSFTIATAILEYLFTSNATLNVTVQWSSQNPPPNASAYNDTPTEDFSFQDLLARIIHDSTSFSSPRGARAPSTSPDLIRIGV